MGSERKANILLVDDQPSNLLALEAILDSLGQTLVRATSGEQALRQLLDNDFAVILMDVKMPGLDGIETAALIRARDKSQHTPIIFLTAFERSEVQTFRGYHVGAVDYLFKPPQPDVLRSKVAVFVELHLKTVELRESERRESARIFAEERQRWEMERLREEAAREKRISDALKEVDRRKDEFLAMLAHELRNPLAPLFNAAHLIQNSKDPALLEEAGEMVQRQVRHMARLIDDLLDVSRINSGKIQLRRESVLLADVVHRAVESTAPLLQARRHELTVNLPSAAVRLYADPTRLEQVLSNLLNNAAKYTPEGGRISLSVVLGPVSGVRCEGQGTTDQGQRSEVVLSIRDNGAGIPEHMLERVFDLFTQVERSLNSASQWGLGIGLALVRTLVEMHGGSVEAHSAGLGQGSEFVVRLPLPEEDRETGRQGDRETGRQGDRETGKPDTEFVSLSPGLPVSLSPGLPVSPSGLRVLVVDDSRDAAQSLALLLELMGHEVQMAHDGPAALAAAQAQRPDVVLLDIGLPHMDGYEVASRLRQQPESERVFLVAMTGFGQEEDRRRSQEAGFDCHLVKPVDPTYLRQIISLESVRGQESGVRGQSVLPDA